MRHDGDGQPVIVVERSSGVGAFLAGAALGALAALLLAPQSGEETRRQIGERARRLRDAAEEKFDDLQEAIEGGYEHAKASVEEGIETARQHLDEKRDRARDAVDAGRAAVRSARDELDRRLAETRAARRGEPELDDAQ